MTPRPSSMPMLAACPAFTSGAPQDFTTLGTKRHAALRAHFHGDDTLLAELDEESQDGVRWAADYIRCHAHTEHGTQWEQRMSFVSADFTDIHGTPDVVSGSDIFDFKWRYGDYKAQMACYAAMLLIRSPYPREVRVHILFGEPKRYEVIRFDMGGAEAVLNPIFDSLKNPVAKPCDYCGWCERKGICKPYLDNHKPVSDGRDESKDFFAHPKVQAWIAAGAHTSELVKDGELAGLLLRWSRTFKKIHEGIEFHVMEAATKHGLKIDGFELKERSGRKFVADTQRAYELSGLPADKFLLACGVRLNTSKTNPDQIGLDKIVADAQGIKIATAKKQIETTLADVIQKGKPTIALVSSKETTTEE